MKHNTKPVGRKGVRGHSVFKRDYIRMAGLLGREGFTDEMTGEVFGVSSNTIRVWRKKWPAFDCALKSGKDHADKRVEESLFKRAIGFSHPETDIRTVSVGNGVSKIVKTPTVRHYPPDTTACIFWLKNRRPGEWRDRQEETGVKGVSP